MIDLSKIEKLPASKTTNVLIDENELNIDGTFVYLGSNMDLYGEIYKLSSGYRSEGMLNASSPPMIHVNSNNSICPGWANFAQLEGLDAAVRDNILVLEENNNFQRRRVLGKAGEIFFLGGNLEINKSNEYILEITLSIENLKENGWELEKPKVEVSLADVAKKFGTTLKKLVIK